MDFKARALDLSTNGVDDAALGRFLEVLAGPDAGAEKNGVDGEKEPASTPNAQGAQNELNPLNPDERERGVGVVHDRIDMEQDNNNLKIGEVEAKNSYESQTSRTSLTSSALPPVGVVIQSASSDTRTAAQPPSRASIVQEFRRERAQSARPAPGVRDTRTFGFVCNPGSSPHRTQPRRPHSCDMLHNSANLDLGSEVDVESAAEV